MPEDNNTADNDDPLAPMPIAAALKAAEDAATVAMWERCHRDSRPHVPQPGEIPTEHNIRRPVSAVPTGDGGARILPAKAGEGLFPAWRVDPVTGMITEETDPAVLESPITHGNGLPPSDPDDPFVA